MSDTPEPSAENEVESSSRPTGWLVGFLLAGLAVILMGVVIVQIVGQDEEAFAAPEASTTVAGGDGGGGEAAGGDAGAGAGVYSSTCQACHGSDGVGIDGLGKALAASDFVQSLSDDELATMIKVGRDTSDPENTTGVAMPPKGGNPALSDTDLQHVVAYLRTLQ